MCVCVLMHTDAKKKQKKNNPEKWILKSCWYIHILFLLCSIASFSCSIRAIFGDNLDAFVCVLMLILPALAKLWRPATDPISQKSKLTKTMISKVKKKRERKRYTPSTNKDKQQRDGTLQPANVSNWCLISFWLQRHPTRSSQVTFNCFSK